MVKFCLNDSPDFEGLERDTHWNGFCCPLFPLESVKQLAAWLETQDKSNYPIQIKVHEDADGFIGVDELVDHPDVTGEPEKWERVEAQKIDGELYWPIGNFSWVWQSDHGSHEVEMPHDFPVIEFAPRADSANGVQRVQLTQYWGGKPNAIWIPLDAIDKVIYELEQYKLHPTTHDSTEALRDENWDPIHVDGCGCIDCTGGRCNDAATFWLDDPRNECYKPKEEEEG